VRNNLAFYNYKGGITVNKAQVIEVTPDKNGNVFITLYGTKYQIVVKEPKPSKTKDKE
jgi:hypothetical protein